VPSLWSRLGSTLAGVLAGLREFGRSLKNGKPLSQTSQVPPPPIDRNELPTSYGRSKVTLMAVDPYLVYAYWDLDLSRLPASAQSAVLRFYDASELAPATSFDVDVDLRAPNWYVHLWSPGKSYYADVVVKTAEGEFVPLATSNRVQTPRAWPAAETQAPIVRQAVSPAKAGEARKPIAPVVWPPARGTQPALSIQEPPARPRKLEVRIEAPKPVHADEVLHQKLVEIYALRSWQPRPALVAAAASSSAPAQPLVVETPRRGQVRTPAPAAVPVDLTALAEHKFFPGLPSSLVSGLPAVGRTPSSACDPLVAP
jgi:hypothetical protein